MDGQIRLGLTFDDVLLEPRESRVMRGDVDLSSFLTKKLKLNIPVISAAMDTVSETAMAVSLSKLGGLTVLHRNCSVDEQVKMVKLAKKSGSMVGAAVGPGDLARALALDAAGGDRDSPAVGGVKRERQGPEAVGVPVVGVALGVKADVAGLGHDALDGVQIAAQLAAVGDADGALFKAALHADGEVLLAGEREGDRLDFAGELRGQALGHLHAEAG